MNYCPKCGNKLNENSKKCDLCGNEIIQTIPPKSKWNTGTIIVLIVAFFVIVSTLTTFINDFKETGEQLTDSYDVGHENAEHWGEKEEKSIVGKWYAYGNGETISFEFKKNKRGVITSSSEGTPYTFKYSYTDDVITLIDPETKLETEIEYSIKSSYLLMDGVKFYSSERKAKENPSLEELYAEQMLLTACSNVDAKGNYKSLEEDQTIILECEGFKCYLEYNEKTYTKDCRY